MAQLPIEVVNVCDAFSESIEQAIYLANSLQNEFLCSLMSIAEAQHFKMYAFKQIKANEFMDDMETIRKNIRGFHPFLIAIVDSEVGGEKYSNLFGSSRAEKGIGVLTVSNVPDVIIPSEKMVSYFLYYFARYTLSYIVPEHKNHDDARGCYYDRKINKLDILKSMQARAFCDVCRKSLLSGQNALSPSQFSALDKIFELCGKLLDENSLTQEHQEIHPRVFIGSSVEGLGVANKVQMLLEHDAKVEVWNQGTVFGLGEATLESLERAVTTYDFGIFVFTPDDQLQSRGEFKPVARDNVIFELGLFTGKLTRRRAFLIHPSKNAIALPSDLLGITTATYDSSNQNLVAALEPACERIRDAIRRLSPT